MFEYVSLCIVCNVMHCKQHVSKRQVYSWCFTTHRNKEQQNVLVVATHSKFYYTKKENTRMAHSKLGLFRMMMMMMVVLHKIFIWLVREFHSFIYISLALSICSRSNVWLFMFLCCFFFVVFSRVYMCASCMPSLKSCVSPDGNFGMFVMFAYFLMCVE